MEESFVDEQNYFETDNNILKSDSQKFPDNLVYTIPIITINNNLMRESMKRDIVMSAICEKLENPP